MCLPPCSNETYTTAYNLPKNQWSMDIDMWPGIGFPDIYMYLISTPGKYTKQSLKAYKNPEAWSYFKVGFVGKIKVTRTPMDILVARGQVGHSAGDQGKGGIHRDHVIKTPQF